MATSPEDFAINFELLQFHLNLNWNIEAIHHLFLEVGKKFLNETLEGKKRRQDIKS